MTAPAPPIAVLSAHPLSAAFRQSLSAITGVEPTFVTLAELRRRQPASIRQFLRPFRNGECCVAVEDERGRGHIPLLLTLSLIGGLKSPLLVESGRSPRVVGLRERILAAVSLLIAGLAGQMALVIAVLDLWRLVRTKRQPMGSQVGDTVLYLFPGLWGGPVVGGAVAHSAGVANALARAGKRVNYVTSARVTMIGPGIEVHNMSPLDVLALPSEVNLYRHDRSFVKQALDRLDSVREGFIYARMTLGNYAGVSISRAVGLPLVLEYNGSEAWISRVWGNRLRYERLALAAEEACLRHAHLVVTVSEVLRDQLIDKGVPQARVVCHPNGVDPATFDPGRFSRREISAHRNSLNIPANALLMTYVGTFGRWHGAEVLASAIRTLAESEAEVLRRSDIHFCFVGDGATRQQAEQIVAHPACGARVRFTGLVPRDQVPSHLAAADVLISPHVANIDGSRFFGSPTKLFEYMAMARPVIASDLEQIGHVLKGSPKIRELAGGAAAADDGCAILCEPGNVDDLAKAIRFAAENPDWLRRAGARARRLVLDRYTWRHHVAEILKGLERISGSP